MSKTEKVEAVPVSGRTRTDLADARDIKGQFAIGNRGGHPGRRNRATLAIEKVRLAILESWSTVGGNAKLKKLAKEDFPEYLRALARFMPRDTPIELMVPFIQVNPQIHADAATGFIAALEARSNGGAISTVMVLEALQENDVIQVVPVAKNGKANGKSNGHAK